MSTMTDAGEEVRYALRASVCTGTVPLSGDSLYSSVNALDLSAHTPQQLAQLLSDEQGTAAELERRIVRKADGNLYFVVEETGKPYALAYPVLSAYNFEASNIHRARCILYPSIPSR